MTDKCIIRETRRNRVHGNNGPKRNQMREFGVIDTNVPQSVIDEILEIAHNYQGDDLRGDNYQISQHCNVNEAFTASTSYRQILLQELRGDESGVLDEIDETNYVRWRTDLSVSAIQQYLTDTFVSPYRARISIMHGGNELNYHIDTDTSVLCRAQIPAQTTGSLFQWKTKTGEVELDMQLGNVYFVNTGWLHRVVNPSDNTRIVLIFGIDYQNIPNREELLI
jgi:hypothetical protein